MNTRLEEPVASGMAPALERAILMDEKSWWNAWALLEAFAVFLIGFGVMQFIYSGVGGVNGTELGVPGNDDFYHIKMSALIPEYGLVREFPWLQYVYFTRQGNDFVSHHYGFHALMVPFVMVSKWLTEDYLAGGKAATSAFFALWLMIFNLILQSERVRWRWMWLLVFLVLPTQFFGRHVFVRAISPSLAFMFLIIFFLFRRRYLWAAITIAAYTHLYLGAVMFSPVIVASYAIGLVMAPREERQIPWKMTLLCIAGWVVGLITYPYFNRGNVFEFLQLQVFGTGLTADIPVGTEWKPYEGLWWFAQMSGALLVAWAASLWLRTRMGPTFGAKEAAVLLMNFAFLVLCMKSRRFIEYWPAFCLLSAALMARPIINSLAEAVDSYFDSSPGFSLWAWVPSLMAALAFASLAGGAYVLTHGLNLGQVKVPAQGTVLAPFFESWPIWAALATIYFLALLGGSIPSNRDSGSGKSNGSIGTSLILFISGAAFLAVAILVLVNCTQQPISSPTQASSTGRLNFDEALFSSEYIWIAAAMIVLIAFLGPLWTARSSVPTQNRWARVSACWIGGLAVFMMMVLGGSAQVVGRQREARCDYDLKSIRGAMNYLKEHSAAGDIVFTDDWDVFPVYFYFNHHNYYIVGLDPKFTHFREPELWERYVQVSRGQVPTTARVKVGKETKKIDIKLEDIRDHFKAKWVVTDSDHKPIARKLANATEFAELVHPGADYDKAQNAPYLVFRIREPGEVVTAKPNASSEGDILYLSDLIPRSVEQEWGEFKPDRTVEGGPIHVGGKAYERGLGTHARSRLDYEIPEGYTRFLAVVGIDRDSGPRGSVRISVDVDGQLVFTSGLITGETEPVRIDIELKDAKRISLKATDGDDGNKYDHVDWADARFMREAAIETPKRESKNTERSDPPPTPPLKGEGNAGATS